VDIEMKEQRCHYCGKKYKRRSWERNGDERICHDCMTNDFDKNEEIDSRSHNLSVKAEKLDLI
jgi:hypothetical protein